MRNSAWYLVLIDTLLITNRKMAAVAFGGAALARGGLGAERTLARFLRGLNVHESWRLLASAAAEVHSNESSNLQEEAVQRGPRRVYLVNQHEPTVHKLPGALKALRAYSLADFEETVEVSLFCKLKTKKGKRRDPFRGTIIFPHRFGKEPKMLVFAEVCMGVYRGLVVWAFFNLCLHVHVSVVCVYVCVRACVCLCVHLCMCALSVGSLHVRCT